MSRLVGLLGLGFALFLVACTQNLTGAGASFPAPLYAKWSEAYKLSSGNGVNYQSIGSGGGIKQIKTGTVDFGATDRPLLPEELNESGLYQFPTVIGGVVPTINVPGVKSGELKLSGQVLVDIFLNKIKLWDDAAIVALNPELKLPNLPITVVHRSDGSGTTFIFTHYLGAISQEWTDTVGVSDTVAWPVGLGGKGNEGVANFVKQTEGAIGYVEYAYATKGDQAYALMQNQAGMFVRPELESFSAAAASADWKNSKGNYLILTNQMGEKTWPISGATFILVPKKPKKPKKIAEVLAFFDHAYTNGDESARALHYVPLPKDVKDLVRQQWSETIMTNGKPVYQPKP